MGDDNWPRGRTNENNYEIQRVRMMQEPGEWNGTNIVTAIGGRYGYNRSKSLRLAIEFAARHEDDFREMITELNQEAHE